MFYHTCIVICIGFANAVVAGDFPPDITICSANDQDVNKCFMETANKLIPHLAEGINGIGLRPLDPFHVPNYGLGNGNTIVPTITFNINDSDHIGFRNSRIITADVHPKAYNMGFTLFLPRYDILGQYEVSGSIVSIPLSGNGKVSGKMYNVTLSMTLSGELDRRGDEKFYNLKSFQLKSDMDKVMVDVDNLFNNKFLSDTTNALLNVAGRPLIKAGLSVVDNVLGQVYERWLRELFDTVPYNRLFTDLE